MKAFIQRSFWLLFALFLVGCVSNPSKTADSSAAPSAVVLKTAGHSVNLPAEMNGEWRDGIGRGWIILEIKEKTAEDKFVGRINFHSRNNSSCRNFTPAEGILQPDGKIKIMNTCHDLVLSKVDGAWVSSSPWDGVFIK
ncbi:hypothetical protein KC926_02880 [Candidatus Kaiserbacteria bacterium]|nr:hypothetical protein [Candidatus Kaiserbacteria bacterium]